jgi:cysteine-rich repeat protein
MCNSLDDDDCGAVCGNLICEDALGEDCENCPTDCINCPFICGNSILEIPYEECEDGNKSSDDACSSICQWTCEEIPFIGWNDGVGTNLFYDDNNNPEIIEDDGGIYLKLDTVTVNAGNWRNGDGFDSGAENQHWGSLKWQEDIPSGNQSIQIAIRASNDQFFGGVEWNSAIFWNSFAFTDDERTGQYLQIEVTLKSIENDTTPDMILPCIFD